MKTPKKNISTPILESDKKHGLTEDKKNELDTLSVQVLNEQANVAEYQNIVNALTLKSNNFQAVLFGADANRTQAFNNKTLIDKLVQSAADLQTNSKRSANEITEATIKTKLFVEKINQVMGKLIYSAEVINKLANVIVRQKALNPLISDDLVSRITTATADANNAIALSLVALQSAFASQATEMEAESALKLEYAQSIALTDRLTISAKGDDATPLKAFFDQAYKSAERNYALALKANSAVAEQLSVANANLNAAQIKLKSLQSGLAAANAAALAS